MDEISSIKEIDLAVTYQCNGRCNFCHIWKSGDDYSLAPIDIKKLPVDIKSVNITGGEPFLREDIVEVVRAVIRQCPKAKITISTNGFSPSLIKKRLAEIMKTKRDIALAISLDGFGKVHEELKGVPGGFSLALETIRLSRELGIRKIKINFCLSDKNFKQLKKIYRLSREMGIDFCFSLLHDSRHYFKKVNNSISELSKIRREISWLIAEELKEFSVKRWIRAYFAYGTLQYLKSGHRILPDYSGRQTLFIDPFGDIYPSCVWDLKLGNLRQIKNWPKFSEKLENGILPPLAPANWIISTANPAISKNFKKVFYWVLIKKLSCLKIGKYGFHKFETAFRRFN